MRLASSRASILGPALLQQVLLYPFHDQLALLVVYVGGEREHACRALRLEVRDHELRIERIPRIDRLEEARRLLDEADEGVLDQERKQPGSSRCLDQHLVAVRQQLGMAVAATELAVVVD